MPATERPPFSPADEAKIRSAILFGELAGQDESKDRGSQWATRSLAVIDALFEASINLGAPPVAIHLMGFEDALRDLRKQMYFKTGIAVSLGIEVDRDIAATNKTLGISRVTAGSWTCSLGRSRRTKCKIYYRLTFCLQLAHVPGIVSGFTQFWRPFDGNTEPRG